MRGLTFSLTVGCLSLTVLAPTLVYCQGCEAALSAREALSRNKTFKWSYVSYTYGGPPGFATEDKAQPFAALPGGTYECRGSITITRSGELTIVDGQEPTIDSEKAAELAKNSSVSSSSAAALPLPFTSFATSNALGLIRYSQDPKGGKRKAYQCVIAATGGGGLKSMSPFDVFLPPFMYPFLAGESPFGCFMLSGREEAIGANKYAIVMKNYTPQGGDQSWGPVINAQLGNNHDMTFVYDDAGKTLISFEDSEERGQSRKFVRAEPPPKSQGVGIPSHIEVEMYTKRDKHWVNKVVWTLQSVSDTQGSPGLPIPKGLLVLDFRRMSKDIGFSNFPPPTGNPVSYRFKGSLPSLDEIANMRQVPRPEELEARRSQNPFLPLLGVLAVATGIFLKLRQIRTRSSVPSR